MSTHKYLDKICCVAVVLSLIFTLLFMNASSFNVAEASKIKGYESRLFDTSIVHTIDIVMDDWDSFIDTCTDKEYALASVVIDHEVYKNVAIRAKGNSSLSNVQSYGNDRYSFKIEFDHYDSTKSYYGLDKLSLNNIIQDNTYVKDFLTYQMMQKFGVNAPLCSYVNITVNGEDWGLYLAVESVEESFLERNYGNDYGELFKPDSISMGGGRGNGNNFDMAGWTAKITDETISQIKAELEKMDDTQIAVILEKLKYSSLSDFLSALENAESMEDVLHGVDIRELFTSREHPMGQGMMPPNGAMPGKGGFGDGMGSDDLKLIYSDDEYDSYSNIFNNAKTDITKADKDRLIASLKQLNSGENLAEVVNVDEVIRYFVVHNFVCNFDSYTGSLIHNYYLYEDDGQLSMIPWDYNLAFGGFKGVSDATSLVNHPIDSPVISETVDSRPMLAWIFHNEEYTKLYHEYFAEFIAIYFDSGYFLEMIDSVKEMIAPFVESDTTKFCTYNEFQTGIDTLKEFCLLRAESVSGQLEGTIGSTSNTQTQNSASLVDASNINISDMGSMENGRGGMNRPNNTFDNSIKQEQTDDTPNVLPHLQQGNKTPPRMQQDSNTAQERPVNLGSNSKKQMVSTDKVILLGISCIVLILGLAFAKIYKKHS